MIIAQNKLCKGKGFKFYWFKINKNGVKQGEAEHCENQLAKILVKIINSEKLSRGGHIGNGKYVGEYHRCQCNKSWREVALVEFSSDNKEK